MGPAVIVVAVLVEQAVGCQLVGARRFKLPLWLNSPGRDAIL